jgi:hypothetical protein
VHHCVIHKSYLDNWRALFHISVWKDKEVHLNSKKRRCHNFIWWCPTTGKHPLLHYPFFGSLAIDPSYIDQLSAPQKRVLYWTYNYNRCYHINANLARGSLWTSHLCQRVQDREWSCGTCKWYSVSHYCMILQYGKRKPFHAYIVHSPSLSILFSYGLAGAVISNDQERCERISKVS